MRLVCISAAHSPYNGALMERSAKRVGVEIARFKQGEPWPKDYRVGKLIHGVEYVALLPAGVTHVMFVDSTDTLFLAGPEEIVEKYEDIRGDAAVMIQGEKNCYPDQALAPRYPAPLTPWHFVNSGGWITRREYAEIAMEKAASMAEYCDQLCWSLAYLDGAPIAVDENCQIFQSMYLQAKTDFRLVNGRLENLKTGGRPCVAHWNGTRNEAPSGLLTRNGVWACMNILSEVVAA